MGSQKQCIAVRWRYAARCCHAAPSSISTLLAVGAVSGSVVLTLFSDGCVAKALDSPASLVEAASWISWRDSWPRLSWLRLRGASEGPGSLRAKRTQHASSPAKGSMSRCAWRWTTGNSEVGNSQLHSHGRRSESTGAPASRKWTWLASPSNLLSSLWVTLCKLRLTMRARKSGPRASLRSPSRLQSKSNVIMRSSVEHTGTDRQWMSNNVNDTHDQASLQESPRQS